MTEEKRINIVIPICLEDDFIGHKGLKSDREIAHLALHGGAKASKRILGTADGPTPIKDVLDVLHNNDNTYVVYINDAHADDPNDPAIQAHFDIFGRHCVVGTEGILAPAGIGDFHNLRRSQIIHTDVLNLVTHPQVIEAITAIIEENEIDDPSQVRFLVLGGLTDVLVADAARGFNHICGIPNPYREDGERWMFFGNVAVSSTYCFSNKPSEHKSALSSMAKVAINILETDQQIFEFLGIED